MPEIEWTGPTINPGIYGCEAAGRECRICYAEIMAARQEHMAKARGKTEGGYIGTTMKTALGPKWTGVVNVEHDHVKPTFAGLPKKSCAVFVTSMADLFHALVPDDFLDLVFDEMEARPYHWFQALTKRPGNATAYAKRRGRRWPENVWLGTSCGDPKAGPPRVLELLDSPAPHLFLSMEPLLGKIDPTPWLTPCFDYCPEEAEFERMPESQRLPDEETGCQGCPGNGRGECVAVTTRAVEWVICGGESATGRKRLDDSISLATPLEPAWARVVRDACARAEVPFFFKQWGDWGLVPPPEHLADLGLRHSMEVVGKAKAGRLLDGVEHLAFPVGWSKEHGRERAL